MGLMISLQDVFLGVSTGGGVAGESLVPLPLSEVGGGTEMCAGGGTLAPPPPNAHTFPNWKYGTWSADQDF